MTNNGESQTCVFCKAYLFEEDDVVYCPVCGAPHHRECYNEIGHCAMEAYHGTDKEYYKLPSDNRKTEYTENAETAESSDKASDTVVCPYCKEVYPSTESKCPNCSKPNISRYQNVYSFGFDFYGGVPKDMKLDEDVTAEDAKNFVAANTHRYLPKFALLSEKKKASWNWIAFLFPGSWLMSRKMYLNGILTYLASIISSIMLMPLAFSLQNLMPLDAKNNTELMNNYLKVLPNVDKKLIILFAVGALISIVLSFFFGILGDWIYKKHVIKTVKELKKESDDLPLSYRKKGGFNLFIFLISIMALNYLPQILYQTII